jgi:monoamine oxidase
MARSGLAGAVQQIASINHEARRRGVEVERVLEERQERRLTRRRFLEKAAKASLLVGLGGWADLARAFSKGSPTIAIVGGGLAGLTCAWRLRQAGINATIYEAANDLGGRCRTRRGFFDEGQIVERGGELIDTGHVALRRLTAQLGLELDDLLGAEPPGTGPLYYFDGKSYSFEQATRDFQEIHQKLHADGLAAGYPTLYNHYTQRGLQLDRTSIDDYLDRIIPGGIKTPLGQLLQIAYNIEYGAETNEQSSLNLLYLLGYSSRDELQLFGLSDERFHIRGGNDQVVSRLGERLADQVKLGTELTGIVRKSDGRFTLILRQGSGTIEVTPDKVVLALPFSILRHSVDLSRAGFSQLKRTAIADQGMGTNSKFHLQFRDRHWHTLRGNGDTVADTGYQSSWDATRAQAGKSGILVHYTGGKIGLGMNRGPLEKRVERFLAQIDPVLSGLGAKFNGRAALEYWSGYQWTRGSYSYWKVGQYTTFAGVEGQQDGNCHFCGEHTSIDFQGYMNGAIDTGERVASEILSDVGVRRSRAEKLRG